MSSEWVVADVFEQDTAVLRAGAAASVRIHAYPGEVFPGRVDPGYPALRGETPTLSVRLQMANSGGLLKPGMFADVELTDAARQPVLTVPLSVVIVSRKR